MDTIFEWLINGHWPISLSGMNTTSWFLSLILLLILLETWTWNFSMHIPTSLSLRLMSSMIFFLHDLLYIHKISSGNAFLFDVTYSGNLFPSSVTCSMTLTLLTFHNQWFWLSHVIFFLWNLQCSCVACWNKCCFICFIDLN